MIQPPHPWPNPGNFQRPVVLAIHGILTGQTETSWPDEFHVAVAPIATVIKCEYRAGPFPRINFFVKNGRLARARANEIEGFHRAGHQRIGIVAHSNGCDIAVRTVRELARSGIRTEAIILTGSVTNPNVRKNGILDLIKTDYLGRAYAYCSGKDLPLRIAGMLFAWPYSDLGRRGWQDVPVELEDRIVTRWYPSYGHSGYFAPDRRAATFAKFGRDLGLAP